MPKTSTSSGNATGGCSSAGWQSNASSAFGFAARGRHLIHHAARRADDQVLDLLTEQRELASSQAKLEAGEAAAVACIAATSIAAEELTPLPARHIRVDQPSHAMRERHAALAIAAP